MGLHRCVLGGRKDGNKTTDQPASLIHTLASLLFEASDPFVDTLGKVTDLIGSQ